MSDVSSAINTLSFIIAVITIFEGARLWIAGSAYTAVVEKRKYWQARFEVAEKRNAELWHENSALQQTYDRLCDRAKNQAKEHQKNVGEEGKKEL